MKQLGGKRPGIRLYIGVDPGTNGGLAWVTTDGVADAIPMPESTQEGDADLLFWLIDNERERAKASRCESVAGAAIELVGGFIHKPKRMGADGQEIDGDPGSSMFNFGVSFGKLRMALTASGMMYEEVRPQQWQKGLRIDKRRKSESKNDWKARLRCVAAGLYPRLRVIGKTADALLIATYSMKRAEGEVL